MNVWWCGGNADTGYFTHDIKGATSLQPLRPKKKIVSLVVPLI